MNSPEGMDMNELLILNCMNCHSDFKVQCPDCGVLQRDADASAAPETPLNFIEASQRRQLEKLAFRKFEELAKSLKQPTLEVIGCANLVQMVKDRRDLLWSAAKLDKIKE